MIVLKVVVDRKQRMGRDRDEANTDRQETTGDNTQIETETTHDRDGDRDRHRQR